MRAKVGIRAAGNLVASWEGAVLGPRREDGPAVTSVLDL